MKYWAYVNNEILGPFEKEKLLALPAFSPSLLICPQTPVGEKTEDWKEAATYPEISAALSPGTLQSAPSAEAMSASGLAAAQPIPAGQDLKSITPAHIDPFPPKESNLGGITLEVNHLERSGRTAPAQEPVAQSAASFDPISLSSISRKADALSGTEAPAHSSGDGIAREPHSAFSASEPVQPLSIDPQPLVQPLAQQPQQQFSAAASGGPGVEELSRKVEALLQSAVSRQDMASFADPLRMKIDQMGEVLSSMKNSQFQREIMDKLAYLENAVGEIKSDLKEKSSAAARPAMVFERNSDTVFGAQPPAHEEKAKPAPAAAVDPKKTVIVDQGSRKFNFGAIFGSVGKKLFKLVMTVVLLTAVAFVAAFALKNAGVFDASKFIPFPVPFLTSSGAKTAPADGPATAAEKPAAEAQPQAQPQSEAAPAEKQAADASPEVIYFARYYTASPGGPKLEDKVTEITAKAGGTYSPANWQAKKYGPDLYEVAAVIPAAGGTITFAYNVDFAKKTIQPADPTGKAAFDALTKTGTGQPRKPGRSKKQAAKAAASDTQEPAAAPPAKGKTKPAAAAKKAGKPAEEEFEYVDEEE